MLNISRLKKKHLQEIKIREREKGVNANEAKYHPNATKEWFNSVYHYNKNTQKFLPSVDISVKRILKGYFNMFNLKLEKRINTPRLRLWMRRLKTNRILVAKPQFKHTNDKVIITLYVYNKELFNLTSKLRKLKVYSDFDIVLGRVFKYDLKKKVFKIKKAIKFLIEKLNVQNTLLFKSLKVNDIPSFNTNVYYSLSFLKTILSKIRFYIRLKKLIFFNKSKFNSVYIFPVKCFLEKVYNKTVEFNIVSLKDYRLNSDLLMQILTIKLRNRDNRLLRVVSTALSNVELPLKRRLQYFVEIERKSNLENFIVKENLNKNFLSKIPALSLNKPVKINDRKSFKVSSLIYKKTAGDKLNLLLKGLYPKQYIAQNVYDSHYYSSRKKIVLLKNKIYFLERNLENTVLDSLQNKVISGIRIEASGRLTKRLIASRAIFKVRQIGSVRNINSSYKKIPSIMLRGKLTSNVEFAKSKHKTRIGAFGLKGWVSCF